MILEQNVLDCVLSIKHLPGKHNQLDHGRRFGKLGHASPVDNLPDDEKADKLSSDYSKWMKNLSPKEYASLEEYTGPSYEEMNKNLRDGDLENSWYKDEIISATSALNRAKAPYNFTVSRGMGLHDKIDDMWEMFQKNKGKTFTDPAFVSTTSDNKKKGVISFVIAIPKGAKGGYVKELSHYSHENEFLLPPKTKFKIIKTEKQYGQRVVYLGMANR